MSYTTAQALLEELMGGVKDATDLEAYLGTAANKGTFDYLTRDEVLAPMLFDDETAFTAVRDSALARTAIFQNQLALGFLTASLNAMVLSAQSSAFMNAIVLKGRAILTFIKSPYLRPACATGTGYTNFATAVAQGGSKLKRTEYTGGQNGTWTRPTTLLWMYVLGIGSGGSGALNAGSYHAGGAGHVVGKVFEGDELPATNQPYYVGAQAGPGNEGSNTVFGHIPRSDINTNTEALNLSYLNGANSLLLHDVLLVARGGVRANTDLSTEFTAGYDWWDEDRRQGTLFAPMFGAPVQDQDVYLFTPPYVRYATGTYSQVGYGQANGLNSPIGKYDATIRTLGGTGATPGGTTAQGYGAGGSHTGGAHVGGGGGYLGIWTIEE